MASSSILVRPPSKVVISVAMLLSFEALSLKHEYGKATREFSWNELLQIFRHCPSIEQPVSDEVDETANGIIGKVDRRGQNRIHSRKHRLGWPHRCAQVGSQPGSVWIVSTHRREDVQVVGDRILERGERAVVEEGRLKAHISNRRGSEFVAVIRIAGDLFQPEVFIAARPIEGHIARQRSDLWDTDDVLRQNR